MMLGWWSQHGWRVWWTMFFRFSNVIWEADFSGARLAHDFECRLGTEELGYLLRPADSDTGAKRLRVRGEDT